MSILTFGLGPSGVESGGVGGTIAVELESNQILAIDSTDEITIALEQTEEVNIEIEDGISIDLETTETKVDKSCP